MRRLLSALLLAACAVGATATPGTAAVDPGTGTEYATGRVVVPLTFPVAGRVSFSDNWLACRSGCARMHMGQDLMSAKMTPLVAAFDGVVTSVRREGSTGGGNYLVLSADRGPAAGWSAIYVHVNNDRPGTDDGAGTAAWSFPAGIASGSRVVAGQLVGWVGDSGNAESTGPHLHFELRKGAGWGGVVHNAYPSLVSARWLARPLPSGPHPDGSLVRHPGGALFVLEDGRKRPAAVDVLATHGRALASAVPMTAAESLGYPTAARLGVRDGGVVRDPRGTTWLVHDGTRTKAGAAQLAALGWSTPRLTPVSDATLATLPVAEALPQTPLFPGALVRAATAPTVHLVGADGALRPVTAPAVLASHGLGSRDVAVVAPELLTGRRTGAPAPLRDGTLVETPAHVVAVVTAGRVHRIWDGRQVAAYGYTGKPRLGVPDALLSGLRTTELTAR